MPDHDAPQERSRPTPSVRGAWRVVPVLACLGIGFGSGAATAEVWELPAPGRAAPVAAPEHEPERVAADAGVRDAQAVSRSDDGRGDLAGPELPPLAIPRLAVPPLLADPAPRAAATPQAATPAPAATTAVPQAAEVPPSTVVAAEPAPEPEPGSGLLGTEVVADLGGALAVVPGESPAPGEGTVRSVRVEVEEGLPVDGAVLAEAVLTTLNDPRGWSATDGVTFSRTDGDEPSIRVVLASPATTDALCAPLDTGGRYSCGNSVTGVAVLNFERWVQGAPDFGDDVATYRQYLVNHEVGHVLGHGHEDCPAPGEVAPVMVQQSMSTGGCLPNGWPAP